jgi:hypothetical protein
MPQQHSTAPRGSEFAPRSIFLEGRFGRLFRNLPSFEPADDALHALAETMREPEDDEGAPPSQYDPSQPRPEDEGDGDIPAGYTYLGQFIDHDVTFDPVSSLQRQNDPDGLQNFRTPRFDLDSLYGAGPNNNPYMYDPSADSGRTTLLVGHNAAGDRDLPRNVLDPAANGDPQGRALIGDPRNDENIIVGQLHLLFLRFHNKMVDLVRQEEPSLDNDILFQEAQRRVRWHYQWIVVNDFLRRVVGDAVIDDILTPEPFASAGGTQRRRRVDLRLYHWQRQPFMPVEFSVAAYRFGHSMIRDDYRINDTVPQLPIFSPNPDAGALEDFRGFRPLPAGWTIDWQFFFETGDGARLQHARKIDTKLSIPTFTLPGFDGPPLSELAFRNLLRGKRLGLPTGQRVSLAMGIEPLDDAVLGTPAISPEFSGQAPLWFYILKEAEVAGGNSLGAVGGRIVAEVLLGLLKGDPFSFVNVEPNWTPELAVDGNFKVPDLLRFVR